MVPILWRYLLIDYFKIFFLCIITFISLLLTTRLGEVAHFATLGPELTFVFWFIALQIPYILPIAIPIATLIASILLFQRLSETNELTAMRSSGLAIRQILAPLLVVGVMLALFNFYVISELATHSHLATTELKNEVRALNPLLLLHNKHLMRLKGFYFNAFGSSKLGHHASDIVFAAPSKEGSRINLVTAKKLAAKGGHFLGRQVTFISQLSDDNDTLLVENMDSLKISSRDFASSIEKKAWTLNNDHLTLSLLLTRLNDQKRELIEEPEQKKTTQRSIDRIHSELIKRFSVALAAFTFTLMGASFGMNISRSQSHKRALVVILLASCYLICFFTAKGIDHHLSATVMLYLIPHLVMIGACLWVVRRVVKGVE